VANRLLEEQLQASYPQAEMRELNTQAQPALDPMHITSDEQVAVCTLALDAPAYLPLRTFTDRELTGPGPQADPVVSLLAGLSSVPDGWRAFSQLVLEPAPDDWSRDYHRLAVEHPLADERATAQVDTGGNALPTVGTFLSLGVAAEGYNLYRAADWGHLALIPAAALALLAGLVTIKRLRPKKAIYDMRLVEQKISRLAYLAELRVGVIAPASASRSHVEAVLAQVSGAYRQFNLATGNRLVASSLGVGTPEALRQPRQLRPAKKQPVLNALELGGLWHLPAGHADVPLLERTGARRHLPLPYAAARGCRIGVSKHLGRDVPAFLTPEMLLRHLFVLAKTGRGKSTLLLLIARYIMSLPPSERPALLLVDPHQDLARAALELVPPSRQGDVIYIDAANESHPVGLNLIDTGLGWNRDKATSNVLAIFKRQFSEYWGPRMESAFRYALLTLFEANLTLCAGSAEGRKRQHTVLDIPALLVDPAFRRTVLANVSDQHVRGWWPANYDTLDRRLQLDIATPVSTKLFHFSGTRAARNILGQPRSTMTPSSWLRPGSIIVVNTAAGTIGEDASGLIGSALLNLVGLTVGEQVDVERSRRQRLTVLVDELQSMPGANFEMYLAELAKYGANLVFATQSLGQLEVLDRQQKRALRQTVFANIDGLFAFNLSAEDARYVVRELGDGVDEADILELGEHDCYARLSENGQRLPTFSLGLDAPPAGHPDIRGRIAESSAALFGRPIRAVEEDLQSALARIEASHRSPTVEPGQPGTGVTKDSPAADEKNGKKDSLPRNFKRDQRSDSGAEQTDFIERIERADEPPAGEPPTEHEGGEQ